MQVVISYLFQQGIKIKLLACTSSLKNRKLWLIILMVWDCWLTYNEGRELFEIQSLWSKAVYCIHVEDLMVNSGGFLVWN